MNNHQNHWDNEHKRIPLDKQHAPYVELVEPEFMPQSVIADLGGGTGADAVYLLEKGHRVIEVDVSPLALQRSKEKASSKGYNLDVRKAVIGVDPLPMDDSSLDGVYSRLALHYFNRETTIKVFKEIYAKLRNNGKAFITIKSPDDEKEMSFLRQTAKEIEPGVFMDGDQLKSRFTINELKQMLEKAGTVNATVAAYIENLEGRNEVTKSGNMKFLLTEIRFIKK